MPEHVQPPDITHPTLPATHPLAPPADEAGLNTGLRSEGVTSLRRAWESSQRSTKEDWAEWMRNFSIELLKQSPSRALRACAALAQTNPSMARELFAAGFVSSWSELDEGMQASGVGVHAPSPEGGSLFVAVKLCYPNAKWRMGGGAHASQALWHSFTATPPCMCAPAPPPLARPAGAAGAQPGGGAGLAHHPPRYCHHAAQPGRVHGA